MNWQKGDYLLLVGHTSKPGAGLSYRAKPVMALEAGASGGWDVYDALTRTGKRTSFYGFSVITVTRKGMSIVR